MSLKSLIESREHMNARLLNATTDIEKQMIKEKIKQIQSFIEREYESTRINKAKIPVNLHHLIKKV
jgi:hypothetical protein